MARTSDGIKDVLAAYTKYSPMLQKRNNSRLRRAKIMLFDNHPDWFRSCANTHDYDDSGLADAIAKDTHTIWEISMSARYRRPYQELLPVRLEQFMNHLKSHRNVSISEMEEKLERLSGSKHPAFNYIFRFTVHARTICPWKVLKQWRYSNENTRPLLISRKFIAAMGYFSNLQDTLIIKRSFKTVENVLTILATTSVLIFQHIGKWTSTTFTLFLGYTIWVSTTVTASFHSG